MIDKSETIEADAFNRDQLKFMKKLVIGNAMCEPIKVGTFNGLDNLEVLNIDGRQLGHIETGVLDVLNGTLKEFSIERADSLIPNTEISIDGFTGARALPKLETVKFKYNLRTSITRGSFVGLTNVKTLDLSNCEIESIAVGSFDSLNTLEVLKLQDNRLTTISAGLFSNILIGNKTQIYLKGNRLLCNCALMPFKMSLIEHSNLFDQPECHMPGNNDYYEIITTKFDDESCVIPTTTNPSPPTSSPPRQCQLPDRSDTLFIDPPTHTMQISQTVDNDVMVRVDNLPENSILIWFSMDDPMTNLTAKTNCRIGSDATFHIDNLDSNSAYTICLMDHTKVTTSPLDCKSFVKRSGTSEPWIYYSVKSRFIGVTFVVGSVSIMLGSAIGGLTYKMWTMKKQKPFVGCYQSSRCSSMSRSRLSLMTRRTTNTTVQYFINGNYDTAPPLPARPASMFPMDEPVYATIRDIRSILAPSQAADNLQASSEFELKAI
ncbi:uncharacterized protein LOC119076069 [Bradysia coprophila]|uniref:uncharacterized protein LOC119076069 n=1 Tax=Bradysia coprophila TaxID=38358 RepID=UPI00187D958A|nr:uncharacterized protein LOC119076069 [Bradysia coprophila]